MALFSYSSHGAFGIRKLINNLVHFGGFWWWLINTKLEVSSLVVLTYSYYSLVLRSGINYFYDLDLTIHFYLVSNLKWMIFRCWMFGFRIVNK